jgi:hypothetical protein
LDRLFQSNPLAGRAHASVANDTGLAVKTTVPVLRKAPTVNGKTLKEAL